jgi:hypothetical protein
LRAAHLNFATASQRQKTADDLDALLLPINIVKIVRLRLQVRGVSVRPKT